MGNPHAREQAASPIQEDPSVLGRDSAKTVLHVMGVETTGKVLVRKPPLAHSDGKQRGAPCLRVPPPWECPGGTPCRQRPCGRTRGLRGMPSPEEPSATLPGRTADAVPRAAEVGGPAWPRRMIHANSGMRGR